MNTDGIRTRKAVIIGAGRVGSHVALCLMFQHLVNEIVFVDVNADAARAQAIDLDDLASGLGDSFTIRVGDYADCADAHFVISPPAAAAARARRASRCSTAPSRCSTASWARSRSPASTASSSASPTRPTSSWSTSTASSACRVTRSLARAPRSTPRACAASSPRSSTSPAARSRPSAWASTATRCSSPPRASPSRGIGPARVPLPA